MCYWRRVALSHFRGYIAGLFLVAGCAFPELHLSKVNKDLSDYGFERTLDKEEQKVDEVQYITAFFDDAPLPDVVKILSEQSGKTIIWGTQYDTMLFSGRFENMALTTVLEVVSRRLGGGVSRINDSYFLGEIKKDDVVSAIIRTPAGDPELLKTALDSHRSDIGMVSVLGGVIWISDRIETLRKMLADIEFIRDKTSRSYMAEVFFLRVKEDDFLKVTGDLRINAIDVFASTINMNEMFSMFMDMSGSSGIVSVDQRPTLYLSEGREASFEVGSEIVREKRAVNKEGVIETTGYERFEDGLNLKLKMVKVSELEYMLDFLLSVSFFDTADKNSVPKLNKSVLTSPGLLIGDGNVHYIGSLRKQEERRVLQFLGIDNGVAGDFLTIWVRVREVNRLPGYKK